MLQAMRRAREMFLTPDERAGIAKRWIEENREAIIAYNERLEKHGLPLERFRRF